MKLRRKIASMMVGLALIGVASVALAPSADAAITGCSSVTYDGSGATASCGGTSGQWRLFVHCPAAFPWETTWTKYSGWFDANRSGALNNVVCNIANNHPTFGIQTR
jgi:hypothetical protein